MPVFSVRAAPFQHIFKKVSIHLGMLETRILCGYFLLVCEAAMFQQLQQGIQVINKNDKSQQKGFLGMCFARKSQKAHTCFP